MDKQYIAIIVLILGSLLPKFGVEIGSEELTAIVSGIIVAISGLYAIYQRTKLQEAPLGEGDVTVLGVKK